MDQAAFIILGFSALSTVGMLAMGFLGHMQKADESYVQSLERRVDRAERALEACETRSATAETAAKAREAALELKLNQAIDRLSALELAGGSN